MYLIGDKICLTETDVNEKLRSSLTVIDGLESKL